MIKKLMCKSPFHLGKKSYHEVTVLEDGWIKTECQICGQVGFKQRHGKK